MRTDEHPESSLTSHICRFDLVPTISLSLVTLLIAAMPILVIGGSHQPRFLVSTVNRQTAGLAISTSDIGQAPATSKLIVPGVTSLNATSGKYRPIGSTDGSTDGMGPCFGMPNSAPDWIAANAIFEPQRLTLARYFPNQLYAKPIMAFYKPRPYCWVVLAGIRGRAWGSLRP